MERHLDRQVVFEDMVDELRNWLEPREYDAGEAIVTVGGGQTGLQLLMTGLASACDSAGARLFQYGPGDAIEARSAFGAYAATVATVADEPCRVMMLTPAARRWLEENESRRILKLYGYLLAGFRGSCRAVRGAIAECRCRMVLPDLVGASHASSR